MRRFLEAPPKFTSKLNAQRSQGRREKKDEGTRPERGAIGGGGGGGDVIDL